MGVDITCNISGINDPDTYVSMHIPEIGFAATGSNGTKEFVGGEDDLRVYLLPPSSTSSLIVKDKGNGVIDIKVVYSN